MNNTLSTSVQPPAPAPEPKLKKKKGNGAFERNKLKNLRKFGERHVQEQHAKRAAATALADAFLARLQSLDAQKTKPAAEIPISTRGIGLLAAKIYRTAINRLPTANLSVHQFYRASLGQMEAQLRYSRQCAPSSVPPLIQSANISRYQAFDPDMKAFNRTFAPITSFINSLGCATLDGSIYVPVVPASELSIVVINDDELTVDGTAPDPYCITLSTLRDADVFLSDPNSPINHRRYFAERNPIPGARWNNNYRLLNPDNIIPPNYDNQDLRNDLIAVRDYADHFKDKVLYAQGSEIPRK